VGDVFSSSSGYLDPTSTFIPFIHGHDQGRKSFTAEDGNYASAAAWISGVDLNKEISGICLNVGSATQRKTGI
jgi:hypothetical protein